MFHRPLICTALTDGLQRLVHFVPSLAANGIQHLTFLHVVPLEGRGIPRPDESRIKQANEQLAVAQSQVPAGIEVKVEVQAGRPEDRILATAKEHQCDLIILGAESHSLLTEKLFGSTGMSLCKSSHIPIFIMRPQLLSAYTVEELDLRCRHLFRYLLLPYDGGDASEYAVSRIKHYAEHRPVDSLQACLLLWVADIDDRLERLMSESRFKEVNAKLAAAKADLEKLHLKTETQILSGEPILKVLDAALEYDIAAIAIASNTLGRLKEISNRSFASEILRRSWHPILFLPMSS